jgi:hypothetical protein
MPRKRKSVAAAKPAVPRESTAPGAAVEKRVKQLEQRVDNLVRKISSNLGQDVEA